MSNIWSYSGETGKRLDGTPRPFEVRGPKLVFPALATDTLSWEVMLADLVPGDELLPEAGQQVTLYRYGSPFFRGKARRPQGAGYLRTVTVEGPWKWLEKEPLSSAVTLDAASGGGAGARASIGFPAQSLSTSIERFIDRMVALGAPFRRGFVAHSFNAIPITLNQGSFAQAFTELIRLAGDFIVAFDYGPADGIPVLNVFRRRQAVVGSANVVTLDAGTLTRLAIEPQDELRVAQVRVPYLDRAVNGQRRFQEQRAGTYEAGHVLLLTASGEEMDTFLPEEKLDSYVIQTSAVSGTSLKNWVMAKDGDVTRAAQAAGISPAALPLLMGSAVLSYQTNSTNLPGTNKNVPVAATTFTNEAGEAVSTAGKRLLLTDASLPEWLKTSYTVEPVKVTGQLYYDFKESDHNSGTITNTYAVPNWWHSIRWDVVNSAGFRGSNSINYSGYELFIHNFSIDAYLINANFPTATTIYRPADYTFIAPPAGFAAGILAARDHVPHRGTVEWCEEECGSNRYINRVINVSNGDPAWATMAAMVQAEELDLDTGKTTLVLGPPARLDFPNLLDQTRTHSAQQIVYL